jgi:hypothetical protein
MTASLLTPPANTMTWPASALGSAFAAYRIYTRRTTTPVGPWVLIAELGVDAGYTPATVEQQHRWWVDLEAGWAAPGSAYVDGWDYAVTVLNSVTGVESPLLIDPANVVPAADNPWLTSNAAPFLSLPLERANKSGAVDTDLLIVGRAAGRDEDMARGRIELPSRTYQIAWGNFRDTNGAFATEDRIRPWRAAVASPRAFALHRPLGDRAIGQLRAGTATEDEDSLNLAATGGLVETQRYSSLSGYNLPAGIVLDGTSQYATTPDNALLNPGSNPFTVFVAGVFPNSGALALSKGDTVGATTSYYGFARVASNQFSFAVRGVTTFGNAVETSAMWFDGNTHVAIGRSSGSAQDLLRDGVSVATSGATHGAITNTKALVAGADNAGAGFLMGLAPLRAWGFYLRRLTDVEAQNLSYYLLGYPGYRMPGGAVVFYDLADDRAWNGIASAVYDLGTSGLQASLVAGPATRGKPWSLRQLEGFA